MALIRILVRLALILAIPAIAAGATYWFVKTSFLEAVNPADTRKVLVEISSQQPIKQVFKDMERRGLVRRWWSLVVLSWVKRQDTQIRAGEYEISPSMTPQKILLKLVSGETFKRKVTVKEGASMWEIGPLLETAGIIERKKFDQAVVDMNLVRSAGLPQAATSFEGYLFPETYIYSRPIDVRAVIWRMLEEGEKRWKPEYTDQAAKLALDRHKILTLASIIEKESGNVEEQPLISSVFHNRLQQGMKLQSDPTVIYAIPDFNGNLTRADLLLDSPYNTYVNYGLPPGPIGNPGERAIEAALNPAESRYLYFVADGTGRHVFSTTLDEHNENVNRFQRGGKK